MYSILHIGLPLAPPWLTADEAEKIAARLTSLRNRMEEAGYRYVVMHASPDEGLKDFRNWLRTHPCDAVLIGGGVVDNPELSVFKQHIVDAVKADAPHAKVLEFDHAVDVQVMVTRALAGS